MEAWKPVLGYEDLYSVSDCGRVRRDAPRPCGRLLIPGGPRKLSQNRNGYLQVELWRNSAGIKKYVHRLVAEAFLGAPEVNQEVNHKNGDKHDNRARNLEWVAGAENKLHAARSGLTPVGSQSPHAKLTEAQVGEIRQRAQAGASTRSLAARYGVCRKVVSAILTGKTWKYTEPDRDIEQLHCANCRKKTAHRIYRIGNDGYGLAMCLACRSAQWY